MVHIWKIPTECQEVVLKQLRNPVTCIKAVPLSIAGLYKSMSKAPSTGEILEQEEHPVMECQGSSFDRVR